MSFVMSPKHHWLVYFKPENSTTATKKYLGIAQNVKVLIYRIIKKVFKCQKVLKDMANFKLLSAR